MNEQLYDKASSTFQVNGSMDEWSRTIVGVKQRCLLSSALFIICLEWIMPDAPEEHDRKVSEDGRISGLPMAFEALVEEEQEYEALVESLDKICTRYKRKINAEKSKLMTNSANGILKEIEVQR